MGIAGLLLRLNSSFVRFLELLAAALCLGIFSYFLADLSHHHLHIPTYAKAVEGIAGAAVLYTLFAVVLTFFLGGVIFFAFLAIVLDLLFMGGFIAIAILTRHSDKCSGSTVRSAMGSGAPGMSVPGGVNNMKRGCKLEEAVFGAAIGAAVLFFISAILQLILGKHHQKEKRYGPGPSNNYGKDKNRPWARKPKATHDAELGAVGATAVVAEKEHHHDRHQTRDNTIRPSGDTAVTGSTMAAAPGEAYGGPINKYANNDRHLHNPDANHDRHLHNHGALGTYEAPAIVTHVPEPEAPRHGDGFPHIEPTHELGAHKHGYTAGTNY